MFSFMLSLLVLTAMFTLISGAAFLLRRTLLKGREGMMYPFWLVILLIAIVPLQINIPELPAAAPAAEPIPEEPAALSYEGDYSELARAERLYQNESAPPQSSVIRRESRFMLELRRMMAASFQYMDDIAAVAFILWLSGATFKFSWSMIDYGNAVRLMKLNSSVCTDERIMRMLDELRIKMGIHRPIRLRMFDIDCLSSPCVCGWMQPTLFVEPGCMQLSDRELACVLTHELTHIRRCDTVLKLFCIFAASIHWLNPTSKRVLRAVFEDCELSCDSHVVAAFGRDISGLYMSAILDFVERYSESNRLVCRNGLGGGLFLSQSSGAAFLKRRYANMKNYRKDRLALVLTGAFTAICAAANLFALSSCSGITPGTFGSAIELTAPVEQMVRAHYGLSQDDFITPEMVDGITTLSVELNDTYENHILVSFTVNGRYEYARALPMIAYENYFESVIMPAVEEYSDRANETTYVNEDGKTVKNNDFLKLTAFYCLKDPDEPELTERARAEMLLTYPELTETGPQYYFDPFSSEREVNMMYQIIDRAGLLDAWELDSYAFDCSSFGYFTNLTEVSFVGLTPVGYEFPDTVNVTLNGESYDTWTPAPEGDAYISEREVYDFAAPTDGSSIVIPANESLNFAIREYFVMQNWNYAKNPLTTKHLEKITSIKAEIDSELSAIFRNAGGIETFVENWECEYVRYTINGYTLDIIPHYLAEMDFDGLWQSTESFKPAVCELIKSSYSWSEEYGCYVLNDDVTEDDKMAMFQAISEISLIKVAIVGKTDDGTYLTQFSAGSAKSGGTPARFLDGVSVFDESDKALFPNLETWEINF